MMSEYHTTQNKELLINIQKFLINAWITNNMILCGKPYSIQKFAEAIHVNIQDIRLFMRDQLFNARIWDLGAQKEMVESLLGEQISWLLEDRMEVAQQVEILRESQGSSYKPFISAELTKALKLKLETSGNLSQLLRTIAGGNTNNINVNIDNSDNHTENNISLEEARILIQQINAEQSTDKPKELTLLETQYNLDTLPEVVANKQIRDTAKEGLNFSKAEINQITDDYKGAMAIAEEEHHETRREIEQNIDPDEEDPELLIYDDIDEDEDGYSTSDFLLPQ